MFFKIHIVEADVPILLSIDDMGRLGIYLNNLTNKLEHPKSGEKADITRTHGHPFVLWNTTIRCFFPDMGLKRLHRRFGHPSTDKLMNLLRRSGLNDVDANTRRTLTKIDRSFKPCQIYAQKPRRFKFTLRYDKELNHTI